MAKQTVQTDSLKHQQRRARRPNTSKRFQRSKDKRIAGVAAGIAEFTDSNPNRVRALFLIALVFSLGIALIPYLLAWVLVPASN